MHCCCLAGEGWRGSGIRLQHSCDAGGRRLGRANRLVHGMGSNLGRRSWMLHARHGQLGWGSRRGSRHCHLGRGSRHGHLGRGSRHGHLGRVCSHLGRGSSHLGRGGRRGHFRRACRHGYLGRASRHGHLVRRSRQILWKRKLLLHGMSCQAGRKTRLLHGRHGQHVSHTLQSGRRRWRLHGRQRHFWHMSRLAPDKHCHLGRRTGPRNRVGSLAGHGNRLCNIRGHAGWDGNASRLQLGWQSWCC